MDVVHPRCCGIEVHQQTVVACLLCSTAAGTPSKDVRTFGPMTADLLRLLDGLVAAGCTHVAMASTGVYWTPLSNLMEGSLEVLVVNARHMKNVPGRKTAMRDAEWIADRLRHGLLRPSFLPDRGQREVRELTRYRPTLVRERAAEVNRLQQVLEGANSKRASVVTELTGAAGHDILVALVTGHTQATELAQLARGRLREQIPALEQALAGSFHAHHRFLVAQQLVHIDGLDGLIERVSAEIAARVRPCEEAVAWLDTIPGIGRRVAAIIGAELGVDRRRFPTAAHLAAGAGGAPGNPASAGKRRAAATRNGSPWLRAALVEAAQAAGRTKHTYVGAPYRRLLTRKGTRRAAGAVAHTLLVMAYHILTRHAPYHDLSANYFDERDQQAVERRLVHRLEALAYTVSLQPPGSVA